LASFLLYLPYRKCCLNADLTDHTLLQRQRVACATLTNGPSGRLTSAAVSTPQAATRRPNWWSTRDISVTMQITELQNC